MEEFDDLMAKISEHTQLANATTVTVNVDAETNIYSVLDAWT